MKKSLLNIITLALVVVNLVLSAVMIFSVLPASSKTNDMITKVCTALDLELESEKKENGEEDYNIDQLETYDIEEELTVPLKKEDGDSSDHYAVVTVSIVVDNKNEDYDKYVEDITTKESLIKDTVRNAIGNFTLEELQNNPEGVQKTVLDKLQKLFDSDFIVKVAFKKLLYQ